METLRRISGKFSRRQHDSAGASSAADAAPVMQDEPKLSVDVRPQATPEPVTTQAEEDIPRSPLTGKPLSPRAQMIRDQLADELAQGPVIF